jgi:hypothetical protein
MYISLCQLRGNILVKFKKPVIRSFREIYTCVVKKVIPKNRTCWIASLQVWLVVKVVRTLEKTKVGPKLCLETSFNSATLYHFARFEALQMNKFLKFFKKTWYISSTALWPTGYFQQIPQLFGGIRLRPPLLPNFKKVKG